MKIALSVTYSDLDALKNYISQLVSEISIEASNGRATAYTIAEAKANLSELIYLQSRLNLKALSWASNRRTKITKKINVSYTQGRIIWMRYDIHHHSVIINQHIQTISKELIR